MIQFTRIPCGFANCFFVEDGGHAILIDTSITLYREKILVACKEKNVRLIILTHGHIDHIQNAAALSKALNVPIAMHADDCRLIRDNLSEPLYADTVFGKFILGMSIRSMKRDTVEAFEPDVYLQDGDTLSEYGIAATVARLPGHTKGSIGVLAGGKDLFVGDALMNMLRPSKTLLYGDKEAMEQSAQKISGLGDITIHFGHGKSAGNRDWLGR